LAPPDRHLDHGGAALLISNMQTNHATLAEHINPFNPNPARARHRSIGIHHAGGRTNRGADRRLPPFLFD